MAQLGDKLESIDSHQNKTVLEEGNPSANLSELMRLSDYITSFSLSLPGISASLDLTEKLFDKLPDKPTSLIKAREELSKQVRDAPQQVSGVKALLDEGIDLAIGETPTAGRWKLDKEYSAVNDLRFVWVKIAKGVDSFTAETLRLAEEERAQKENRATLATDVTMRFSLWAGVLVC